MRGRERRAWHPDVDGPGQELTLGADESHHLSRVLRLRAGDEVLVFDGRGGEWLAEVVERGPTGVRLRVGDPADGTTEPPIDIILWQSVCRAERLEWAIQKGTEAGIGAFRLLEPERATRGIVTPSRLRRWRRVALEAAKQSGRRVVPDVEPPVPLPPAPAAGAVGFLLDPEAERLGGRIRRTSRPDAVWLAVGPEGGFTERESASMMGVGWAAVGVGPRILRSETAGLLAAAAVLHAWGDLG